MYLPLQIKQDVKLSMIFTVCLELTAKSLDFFRIFTSFPNVAW